MKNDALDALNRAWVEAELVMKPEFEAYYGTIRQSLTNAPDLISVEDFKEYVIALEGVALDYCKFIEKHPFGIRIIKPPTD